MTKESTISTNFGGESGSLRIFGKSLLFFDIIVTGRVDIL
jgi:hypothetical protein